MTFTHAAAAALQHVRVNLRDPKAQVDEEIHKVKSHESIVRIKKGNKKFKTDGHRFDKNGHGFYFIHVVQLRHNWWTVASTTLTLEDWDRNQFDPGKVLKLDFGQCEAVGVGALYEECEATARAVFNGVAYCRRHFCRA